MLEHILFLRCEEPLRQIQHVHIVFMNARRTSMLNRPNFISCPKLRAYKNRYLDHQHFTESVTHDKFINCVHAS